MAPAEYKFIGIVNSIIQYLEQEIKIYKDILKIAQTQKNILEAGETGDLIPSMEQKDRLFDEIRKVEVELLPIKSKWMKVKNKELVPLAEKVEILAIELNATMKQLLEIEKENEELIAQRMENITNSISSLQDVSEGRRAYEKGSAPEIAKFINVRK